MVDRVGFKVEGLSRVVRELKASGLDVADLKTAFSAIALEGAAVARGLAPKKTGRLANSIRGNKAVSKAVITAGRSAVPYAGPINYGWSSRSIAPSLFMQRTDERMRPIALAKLSAEINRIIASRGLNG